MVASPTPPDVKEESPRRRAKLYRSLVVRLTEILPGGGELEFALANAQGASCSELRQWLYRSLYHQTWDAIADRLAPLSGIELVRFDSLLSAAIACPLGMWCLRAEYHSTRDCEQDISFIGREAPWLRDSYPLLNSVVQELQYRRTAILACETERLARGLLAASFEGKGFRRRLWISLYNDRGLKAPR